MRTRLKFSFSTVAAAVVAVCVLMVMLPQLHPIHAVYAQANLKQPNVTQNTATTVKWTAGTLNNGGHSVTVTASSGSVSTSMNDCTSPGYAACNFVYANSGGTVAVTTSRVTAFASGNTLMAYVETSGSAITKLSFPQQANTAVMSGSTLTDCVSSLTCASPVQTYGTGIITAMGSATLTGGAATISGISPAFNTLSSFGCTATFMAGTTTGVDPPVITRISTSSFSITANQAVNQTLQWLCMGR